MKKKKFSVVFMFVFFFFTTVVILSYAQEQGIIPVMRFKDADIKVVLQSISEKAVKDGKKVNILTSPEVEGLVSISLENVSWLTALDAVLKTYNYSYIWVGENIILVDSLEKIQERESRERERQEVEVPRLKVFKLNYVDANDAKKAITPLLSTLGRISVLELTGQAGWEFGTDVTKRARANEGKVSRTKVLVVSDISKKLGEIEQLLLEIDTMPQQVLVKAKIMEVATDYLKDIGFDWGTGSAGASSDTLSYLDVSNDNNAQRKQVAGHMLSDQNAPSLFGAKTTGLNSSDTGLKMAFKKLGGAEFELIMHALEEDARTNTLSSPSLLTLNNQEAGILIGEKYPIVSTEVSSETGTVVGGALEEYKDIGIQLNVVPQICGEGKKFINMIIHPAVTSLGSNVSIQSTSGTGSSQVTTTLASYPRINTREAETQIIVEDGETIVIGGLLKEVKSKQVIGVPFLRRIPLLGKLFSRETEDTEKIDLLVFISATIVQPGETVPAQAVRSTNVLDEMEE